MGLAAGKNVYVEKPCGHNAYEGEPLVRAVEKYKGVLQMGNQRRSFPNIQQAIQEIHNGLIGKAYFARAWYVNKRAAIGNGNVEPVPAWLDYELWQGPAPRRPYRSNLVHYNWHWFWHWGTGEALNNGTHEVDVCRWALGVDWPTRVTSNGGRYHYQDDWETPDTQTIVWDYAAGKTISWEGRSCNDYPIEKLSRGVMVYGTEGAALLDSNNYTIFDKKKKIVKEAKEKTASDGTNVLSATGMELDKMHFVNFIEAIREGKPLNSPIAEAHKSVAMLHIGNMALRVGRTLNCDAANGHVVGDPDAMKLWIANDLSEAFPQATLRWTVSRDGQTLLQGEQKLDVPPLNAVPGETINLLPVAKQHPAFDVTLTISDASGRLLSRYQRTVRVVPEELLQAEANATTNDPFNKKK
jgi:predicted dehydrogenase